MSAPLTTRKDDAVTTGGQMTVREHNEELPPVAFRINIPAMTVRVSGSDPSRTGTWRRFPSARLPSVGIAIPAVISANPDMITAWAKGAVFPNADRWPKPYNDLRMSRYYPKCQAKQRGENQFSHFRLLRLYVQVHGRSWCFDIRTRKVHNAAHS
jgi:hypothetical protein